MPVPDPPAHPALPTEYVLHIEWHATGPPARRVRLCRRDAGGGAEWTDFTDPDALLRHLWHVLDHGPGLR